MIALRSPIAKVREALVVSRRGIADTAVSLLPQIVNAGTGLVSSVLIARGLGPARLGEYALITSIAGISALFSDLGIGGTAIRYTAWARKSGDGEGQLAILRWAFRLRVAMVLAVSAAAFSLVPFLAESVWHAPHLTPLIRTSLLIGICGALASIPLLYFQSQQNFRANARVAIAQSILSFSAVLVIAVLGAWSLWALVLVSVGAAVITAVSVQFLVPRRTIFLPGEFSSARRSALAWLRAVLRPPALARPSGQELDAGALGGFAIHMVASSAIQLLVLRVDVWLMGAMLSAKEIGLYSVATKFTLPLAMVVGAVHTALLPRASSIRRVEELRAMLVRAFRLTAFASLACVAYAVVAPLLAPRVFGAPYAPATLLAQVLCLRFCAALLSCPASVAGYSLGLVRVYWVISGLQLAVVLTLNLLLLPRIGALAAPIALLVQDVLGAGLVWSLVWRRMRPDAKLTPT